MCRHARLTCKDSDTMTSLVLTNPRSSRVATKLNSATFSVGLTDDVKKWLTKPTWVQLVQSVKPLSYMHWNGFNLNVSYCCGFRTGILSWWVCLQPWWPVGVWNLRLSDIRRWDSWMVAFPINWSLLLVSLCQISTSSGTLQDAQIHTLIQTCLEPLPNACLQNNI